MRLAIDKCGENTFIVSYVKFMEKFMKIISLVQIALRGQRQIYHKCG
jgi:hypothetical protein